MFSPHGLDLSFQEREERVDDIGVGGGDIRILLAIIVYIVKNVLVGRPVEYEFPASRPECRLVLIFETPKFRVLENAIEINFDIDRRREGTGISADQRKQGTFLEGRRRRELSLSG